MWALGLKRIEIVMVFFLEAIVLSFIGSLTGTLIGGILTYIISQIPISLDLFTGGIEMQYSNTIFFAFSFGILSFSFLFGLLMSSVCTIFPSLKSAFIEPVEALRR
jgi:putative ABC transport system permease protein